MINKETIYNDFKKLQLIEKADIYIKTKLLNDETVVKEIFNKNILENEEKDCFRLETIGIDICKLDNDFLRYKLSYSVMFQDEWIKNYYLYFDELGNYIDDFFDS